MIPEEEKPYKMKEVHNHTENADKFKGALDEDALIYQQREEKTGWEQFRSLHGKKRWAFFCDYYLRYVLLVLAAALLLFWFIFNRVTAKKDVLNLLVINNYGTEDEAGEEAWFDDFLEQNDCSPKKNTVSVSSSIFTDDETAQYSATAVQVVVTRFAAQDVDLCFSDEEYFLTLAENGYFGTISDYLTPEEMAALGEDRIVYASVTEGESEEETESGRAASSEELPVGIRLDPSEGWLKQMGWYEEGQEVVLGLPYAVKNEELALSLLGEILS